jgi:hypothetical protein
MILVDIYVARHHTTVDVEVFIESKTFMSSWGPRVILLCLESGPYSLNAFAVADSPSYLFVSQADGLDVVNFEM